MKQLTLTLLIGIAAGCAAGGEVPSAMVTDSAGIRIVTNVAGSGGAEAPLSVDSIPRLTIGGVEVDTTQQLYGVVAARRLADGRLVIANAGTHQVRFYAPDGTHLADAGGEGGGPAEFQQLGGLLLRGDTLLAVDTRARKVVRYWSDGEFIDALTTLEPVVGVFPDGSYLTAGSGVNSAVTESLQTGWIRPTIALSRWAPDGEAPKRLLAAPGTESYLMVGDGSISILRLPFTRRSWQTLHGDRLAVAANDTYEIRIYDASGALTTIIRRPEPPRPFTGSDQEAFLDAWLPDREPGQDPFGDIDMPEHLPAFGWTLSGGRSQSVQYDDTGRLWVRELEHPAEPGNRWTVFDGEGRLMQTMTLPAGLQPLHIGADFVLGRWQDELDVEYVRLYGLRSVRGEK